jgi:hypothetical protein
MSLSSIFLDVPEATIPLSDVLLCATRGLNHLVSPTRAAFNKPVAEEHGQIVDDLCGPIGLEIPIPPVRSDQFRVFAAGSHSVRFFSSRDHYRSYRIPQPRVFGRQKEDGTC